MRWEIGRQTITVMPDTPYLRNYRVDYVNMARDVNETVGIATQVISRRRGAGAAGGAAAGLGRREQLDAHGHQHIAHRFWETLEKNIKDLLRETDKQLPEGSSETFVQNRGQSASATSQARGRSPRAARRARAARRHVPPRRPPRRPARRSRRRPRSPSSQRLTFREAASVIVNPETGIVSVRATSRQHEKVREFLEQVTGSSQAPGADRGDHRRGHPERQLPDGRGLVVARHQRPGLHVPADLPRPPTCRDPVRRSRTRSSLGTAIPTRRAGGSISSTIKLLDTFGRTRVLSSPKLMVMNNQTAMLKVVDNEVYFTVKADTSPNQRRHHHDVHHHAERGARGLHHERDAADQRGRHGHA